MDRPWRGGSRGKMEKDLIVGLGGVGFKGMICEPIRQLTVGLGKVIILVQEDSYVSLIGRENKDVGVGVERSKCRFFGFGVVGLLREDGWKFRIRDVGDVTFNGKG